MFCVSKRILKERSDHFGIIFSFYLSDSDKHNLFQRRYLIYFSFELGSLDGETLGSVETKTKVERKDTTSTQHTQSRRLVRQRIRGGGSGAVAELSKALLVR